VAKAPVTRVVFVIRGEAAVWGLCDEGNFLKLILKENLSNPFHQNPFKGFGSTGVEICSFSLLSLLAFTTACRPTTL